MVLSNVRVHKSYNSAYHNDKATLSELVNMGIHGIHISFVMHKHTQMHTFLTYLSKMKCVTYDSAIPLLRFIP